MKVILFDFDGVIADTYSFCYRIASAEEKITDEEYRAWFEGNINDAEKERGRAFAEYVPELMKCKINPELVGVIKELAKSHTLIIVSSTISEPIAKYLSSFGLNGSFKEILGNEVEKSKIKKISGVMERYGISPAEAIFVTDTLGDIKEAAECGVQSIAVTWGFHPASTLMKGTPRFVVNRPAEISEAIKKLEAGNVTA